MHTPRTTIRRAAFSLTEVMIATGILGVGLIMLASIFPVALSQHRDSYDAASAASFARTARAAIVSKVQGFNAQNLWRPVTAPGPTPVVPPGRNSPWMVLPFPNISASNTSGPPYANTGDWDSILAARAYAGSRNPAAFGVNSFLLVGGGYVSGDLRAMLTGVDILSDARPVIPIAPRSADDHAEDVPWRMVWYGFYRETADGQVQYAAAICRQSRGNQFLQQGFRIGGAFPSTFAVPTFENGLQRRFPVPWRMTLAYDPTPAHGPKILHNDFAAGNVLIGEAAPPGSKIMISGWTYLFPAAGPPANLTPTAVSQPDLTALPPVPAGRVLTVTQANGSRIEVLEDISDLPDVNVLVASTGVAAFDVWVFPPDVSGGVSGKSPVMDWIFF